MGSIESKIVNALKHRFGEALLSDFPLLEEEEYGAPQESTHDLSKPKSLKQNDAFI